jgi:hypothetical protein
MIIANFTAAQTWGLVLLAIFMAVGLTFILTRQFSTPYKYRYPLSYWRNDPDNQILSHKFSDYRGNGETIAETKLNWLAPDVRYLNYWNMALTGPVSAHVLLQPNGAFLAYDGATIDRWHTDLQTGRDIMPLALSSSTTIADELLDGVDRAHHYKRLLAVSRNQSLLAICRLRDDDPSSAPWLLIYRNAVGRRYQLRLTHDGDVTEAARQAALAIIGNAEKPDGVQWDQASDL